MGRVELRCWGGCSCEAHVVDAHRVSYNDRNVSVYREHVFAMSGASASCTLRARVLKGTSSGGHKFKLRFVVISADEQQVKNVSDAHGDDEVLPS